MSESEPQLIRYTHERAPKYLATSAVVLIVGLIASACNSKSDDKGEALATTNMTATTTSAKVETPAKDFWEQGAEVSDPDALQKLLEEPQANGKTLKEEAITMIKAGKLVINGNSPLQIGRVVKKEGQPVWISPQDPEFKDDARKESPFHMIVMSYRDMKLFNTATMAWAFGADTRNTKNPFELRKMNDEGGFDFDIPKELGQAKVSMYVTENNGNNVMFMCVGGKVNPQKGKERGDKAERTGRNINLVFERKGAGNDAVVEMRLPAANE